MNSALDTARVIWEDLTILSVTSWQHWIAVSHYDYCDGLLYINPKDRSFETTKRYYATGNFSKYIPRGARRVGVSSADRDLKLLAFVQDDTSVLIIINESEKDKRVSIPDCPNGGITLAVTNEKYNLCEFALQNGNDIRISAESVNTIVY